MRKGVALAILLFSSAALADPSVFKMELGKTTETQLKSMYQTHHKGVNKYSDGNMYSIPTSAINFDGLQEVTVIFDAKGVLVAVLTTLPKSKFEYLNQTLGGKYQRVSQNIPFVGNKSATYRDGGTEITLDAPHMSFDMSMNYIRDDFMRVFNERTESERRKKQQSEASQL